MCQCRLDRNRTAGAHSFGLRGQSQFVRPLHVSLVAAVGRITEAWAFFEIRTLDDVAIASLR